MKRAERGNELKEETRWIDGEGEIWSGDRQLLFGLLIRLFGDKTKNCF
jgi:hypothetical protein